MTDGLGPRARLPGLWPTGQGTLTWGVTGNMMPGRLTATALAGMRRILPLMKRIYG